MEHSKKTTREEYQKCVNAVVDYINLHLGEEIDLKSLAKISHFSPFYFHRIMKAFLGEPIGTFIVRTRTESAARLLRYSDLPIADIAYRIGYSSPSSLSKVFKQFYGISPNELVLRFNTSLLKGSKRFVNAFAFGFRVLHAWSDNSVLLFNHFV